MADLLFCSNCGCALVQGAAVFRRAPGVWLHSYASDCIEGLKAKVAILELERDKRQLFDQISRGMVLYVGPAFCRLVECLHRRFPQIGPIRPDVEIPRALYNASIGDLYELTEMGSPPPALRNESDGCRFGWRELKLDPPAPGCAYFVSLH